MEERFTGLCPVKACEFRHKADAEMLASVLVMHLRDEHQFTMSEATPAAGSAVKHGQETAFKVSRMVLALAEVFGSASELQARAVLKAMTGQGLVIRAAAGNAPRPRSFSG